MTQGVIHGADFVLVVFKLQGEGDGARAIAEVSAKSWNTFHSILQQYDLVTGKLLAPEKTGRPCCTAF